MTALEGRKGGSGWGGRWIGVMMLSGVKQHLDATSYRHHILLVFSWSDACPLVLVHWSCIVHSFSVLLPLCLRTSPQPAAEALQPYPPNQSYHTCVDSTEKEQTYLSGLI